MTTKYWPPTLIAARCPKCSRDFSYADSLPSVYILWCPYCDWGSYDRSQFADTEPGVEEALPDDV